MTHVTSPEFNPNKQLSKSRILWTLFKSMFMLSACTFGGGFVIVSLMKKKYVEELKWLSEDEMLDITAITQSSPGPLPVNCQPANYNSSLLQLCRILIYQTEYITYPSVLFNTARFYQSFLTLFICFRIVFL